MQQPEYKIERYSSEPSSEGLPQIIGGIKNKEELALYNSRQWVLELSDQGLSEYEKSIINGLKKPMICELDKIYFAQSIYLMVDGLRPIIGSSNIPTIDEFTGMHKILSNDFGSFTLPDVKNAIEMNVSGKYWPTVETFGSINASFLAKVLNQYQVVKNKTINKAQNNVNEALKSKSNISNKPKTYYQALDEYWHNYALSIFDSYCAVGKSFDFSEVMKVCLQDVFYSCGLLMVYITDDKDNGYLTSEKKQMIDANVISIIVDFSKTKELREEFKLKLKKYLE